MATKASETLLSSLVINHVSSAQVFQEMITANQVNENQLYLIEDDVDLEPITNLQIDSLFS